jgi:hypothetical protein
MSRALPNMTFFDGGVLTVSPDVAPPSRLTRIEVEVGTAYVSSENKFTANCAPLECFLQQIEDKEGEAKRGASTSASSEDINSNSSAQSVYYIDFLSLDGNITFASHITPLRCAQSLFRRLCSY